MSQLCDMSNLVNPNSDGCRIRAFASKELNLHLLYKVSFQLGFKELTHNDQLDPWSLFYATNTMCL